MTGGLSFNRMAYFPNIKARGQVVSDKKIFENSILKKTIFYPGTV